MSLAVPASDTSAPYLDCLSSLAPMDEDAVDEASTPIELSKEGKEPALDHTESLYTSDIAEEPVLLVEKPDSTKDMDNSLTKDAPDELLIKKIYKSQVGPSASARIEEAPKEAYTATANTQNTECAVTDNELHNHFMEHDNGSFDWHYQS
jgi:hypothetical protein